MMYQPERKKNVFEGIQEQKQSYEKGRKFVG